MQPLRERTFEVFYESEYHAVFALARVLTGDDAKAEDVTHDAFTAAYETWDTLDNPAGWVRRVASNRARTAWRRTYAERRAVDRLKAERTVGYQIPPETESFWATVRKLPKNQANAIALHYLEDLPVANIAEVLGCQESTARVHLSRGRRKLAKLLEVEYE